MVICVIELCVVVVCIMMILVIYYHAFSLLMPCKKGREMTPEYRIDAEKKITEYLKSQDLVNIKNMQVEKTFNDLGHEVNIWNVRTKNDGNWWVAE